MTQGAGRTPQGCCKGIILRQVLQWYGAKYGLPALEKIVARVPPPHSSFLIKDRESFGLLASTWYPSPLLHSLLEGMVESGCQAGALAREASTAIMTATMTGLYRALFQRLATPALYARYANTAWTTYYDTGRCELDLIAEGHIDSRVTGWLGHHPILCDMNTHASVVIFTAMSCHHVRTQKTACVSRGDSHCAATILWTGRR